MQHEFDMVLMACKTYYFLETPVIGKPLNAGISYSSLGFTSKNVVMRNLTERLKLL